jgi:D-arabinose 1-dehydrogenase-like Zn-dependent alcohol dehydrogenase
MEMRIIVTNSKLSLIKEPRLISGNQSTVTMGGYSGSYVVHESFCLKIPNGMPLELSAPILCSGITMYSPL